MAHLSNSSWWANAACMAEALCSHILVEPSMSVNKKVTVPVGGLAVTTSMSSSLPLKGHYSSEGIPRSLFTLRVHGGVFAAFAEHACPPRSNLCERVTDRLEPATFGATIR
jgi:hypothetical protein